jgi:replicative DNA helicase
MDESIKIEVDNLEEKLLYILLNYPDKSLFIFSNCLKDFFEDFINARIFEIASSLWDGKTIIEPATICTKLTKSERERVTLRLFDIQASCFAVSPQCKLYCRLLFEKYLNKCYKTIKTEDDFKKITALKGNFSFEDKESSNHISENIDSLINGYSKDITKSIFTLYGNLDNCIGSLSGGDYVVLGASTSVGKSTFALNMARNVCIQEKSVLYFSLEMPLEQIQNKFICMQEGLNANKYRSFGFDLVEWEKFKKGAKELKQWNFNVVCDYGLTSEKMHQYMTQQKAKGLDFVIVDYLGLMSGYSNKTLYEKMTILSRSIKLFATEFNVPILCLVQLNRDLKNRPDKRPCLFDIRESGAIEQDADIVLLLHREGIYNENVSKNLLEVIIAKNRHGEANRLIKLDFDLKTQLIKDF